MIDRRNGVPHSPPHPRPPARKAGLASAALARLIAACSRRARWIVTVVLVLTAVSGLYVANHFSIRTDTAALISPDVTWRKHERRFERAFPAEGDDITVVIDGATPELADQAAAALTARLEARKDLYLDVDRPDGGPFFEREGLLFLSLPELQQVAQDLITAQPMIGSLAADPSLRGVMTSLGAGLDGVTQGQVALSDLERPIRAITEAAEAVESGRPAFFSWRRLIAGQVADLRSRRKFVELQPKVDYSTVAPGADAVKGVRDAARDLKLTPSHGVTVRLTGSVPMDDEELATLEEATGPIAGLMLVLVLAVLYLAVRSPRIILCILATVVAGLSITSAAGLLIYGRFNLISVAFLPLFVGLGVDFAIQFSVRFRAESVREPESTKALAHAGAGIGKGLFLAAATTSIGFFAFLPTGYRGVSELGFIAGLGMIVAFLLTVSFLPALLLLVQARSGAAEGGLRSLANADAPVQRLRRAILLLSGAMALVCLGATPFLHFNFDPLRLRNPKTESVSTYLELARSADTTPNTLDVLGGNLDSAIVTAKRLSALPEVGKAVTLASFVPPDQPAKLALISDASTLLDPTLNPFDVSAPPSGEDIVRSLRETARKLGNVVEGRGSESQATARRLAVLLERAASSPRLRAGLQEALVSGLPAALAEIRVALQAQPVSLGALPADIRDDWVAGDGQARIQVFPSADPRDPKAVDRFVRAVERTTRNVTGAPITVRESGRTILLAFAEAAVLSGIAVIGLLFLALRNWSYVWLALAPVMLSGLLTIGTCVLLGQDINLENIIALPMLLGIGVSFNIYFVVAWRAGERKLLKTSLTRAVLFSALTTASAFGALALSAHPGTASMGVLLLISLAWTLATTLVVQPALLGAFSASRRPRRQSAPWRNRPLTP